MYVRRDAGSLYKCLRIRSVPVGPCVTADWSVSSVSDGAVMEKKEMKNKADVSRMVFLRSFQTPPWKWYIRSHLVFLDQCVVRHPDPPSR